MNDHPSQSMKPATAAKKLGVHLPATPEEFRERIVPREEYERLRTDPPAWLVELRRNGPHPRPVVAAKLGVSISGLMRSGQTGPLTTAEITALLQAPPPWLVEERAIQAAVREEQARVKNEKRARDEQRSERGEQGRRG